MKDLFFIQQSGDIGVMHESFHVLNQATPPLQFSKFAPTMEPIGNILLLPDVFGRSVFYRQMGQRLANSGFVVYVPELFGHLNPVAEGDGNSALQRLAQLDQRQSVGQLRALLSEVQLVGTGAVNVLGFSLGGTLGMVLGTLEDFNRLVVFYGFPARRPATENAPFIVVDDVKALRVPLLGFWGVEDPRIDAQSLDELEQMLTIHHKMHKIVRLPNRGHSFLGFSQEGSASIDVTECWNATLDFSS